MLRLLIDWRAWAVALVAAVFLPGVGRGASFELAATNTALNPLSTGAWFTPGDGYSPGQFSSVITPGRFIRQRFADERGGVSLDPKQRRFREILGPFTYAMAHEDARRRGGHLAVITSAAEQQEMMDAIGPWDEPGEEYRWLGGSDQNVEGRWEWVTGESFVYQNWNGGEPDDSGNEDFIELSRSGETAGRWHDVPGAILRRGYILEIESNNAVVRGVSGGTSLFVESMIVGMPYLGKASEFLIGSIIPPLSTDEQERLLAGLTNPMSPGDYWEGVPLNHADALNSTNENYGRFYYSPSKREVFATSQGSTTIKWIKRVPDSPPPAEPTDATRWLDRGGVYHRIHERTYVVSASPVKRPRRIYHTDGGGANGLAVYVPSSRIASLKVVYNNSFPERMPVGQGTPVFSDEAVGSSNPGAEQAEAEIRGTLFYSPAQNVLRAANKEGRVFVELIGPLDPATGIGEHLGFEVVDVIADAIPNTSKTSLGDPFLRPTVHGGTGEILYPKVGNPPEGNSYVYSHNPTGSELETTFYAVRETKNINDISVWWMIEGEQGILWPEQLHRYDLKWPDAAARFSHYIRPAVATDAEAQTTAVLMPRSNSARIEFQDGEEAPRAKFTADFRFYTHLTSDVPAHRTLLSFKSGNDIAFERVFSWLQGNLETNQWAGTVAAQLNSWRDTSNIVNGVLVKEMVWEVPDRMPRQVTQDVNVGQRIEPPETDPNETRGYVAGWLQVDDRRYDLYDPLAYVNPFVAGFDEAASGGIIPVNAIEGRNQLKVFWFRRNQFPPNRGFEAIYWPSVVGTYEIRWPHEDPQWRSGRDTTVVLASNDGSGGLGSLEAKGSIYYQNDDALPGYNPNEEHAVMIGGQAYALRDDLNDLTTAGYSSEPYILLSYRDENDRPRMRTFRVLREDAENTFEFPLVAGTVIQPPMPLPLLPKPVPGDTLRDRFLDNGQAALAISLNRIIEPVTVQLSSIDSTNTLWTLTAANGMFFGDYAPLYLEPTAEAAADATLHFLGDAVDWPTEIRGYVSKFPVVRLPVPDPEYTTSQSVRYTLGSADLALLSALATNDRVVLADRAGRRTYLLKVSGTDTDPDQRKLTLSYADTESGSELGQLLFDGVPLMLIAPSNDAAHQATDSLGSYVLSADRFPPELPGTDGRFSRYRVPVLKDRKGNQWAYRGPHRSGDGTAGVQAHWFYRTQEGFFFPSLSTQPAVGSLAPYLRPREADGFFAGPVYIDQSSTNVTSFPVSYRIRWPDSTPELRPGQTLAAPVLGLPAVRGNTSAEVLYEQSIATTTNLARSVALHDPTREKEYKLGQTGGLSRIPDSIRTSSYRGRTYFPNLPPHLVERLFLDPNRGTNGALVFKGEFKDEPVGEDYFLLNTAAGADLTAMHALVDSQDPNEKLWVDAIDGLTAEVETFEEDRAKRGTYKVARTVNRLIGELVEVDDDDTAVDSYALSANGPGRGYVSLFFGNGLASRPFEEPMSVQILRVDGPLHRGEVKPITAANPLAEKLTMLHTADLAASTHLFEYDWRIAAPVDGAPPPVYEKEADVLNTSAWKELVTLQAGEAGNSLPATNNTRWRGLELGAPLTVVERKVVSASTYDSPTQRLRLTLSGGNRFSVGDAIHLQDFVPTDLNGVYTVLVADGTNVTVAMPSFDGAVQTHGSATEEASAVGAQSILRGWFTLPTDEEWDDVHVSVDPDARLGFRLWINGSLAVVREWPGVPDTATVPAPYGFTPLTRIYRLDSALARPGTHALVLELRSTADAGAALPFALKVEANRWVDHPNLRGSQWLARETIAADLRRIILGESADVQALGDNYLIVRYRATNENHSTRFNELGKTVEGWSKWTDPALAEGWIKRVLAGINPFNQRVTDLFANRVDTSASVLTQAGPRWEGDVALSLENINDSGLIEIYETVMNRGRTLSIDAGINYGPANDALLLAAGYLNDLYVMLGNEAWADAANPTIGIGSKDGDYGSIATALFAFKGQLPSLIDEELALLRGRDDFLQPGTRTAPVYNRLFWNYTRGIDSGEVIYALNYNILEDNDQGGDGTINADDARKMFPQGHGDAYGHYLTALKGYYQLLMAKDFTWVPRTEAVNILGKAVQVDYADERKFAAAGAAVARTGKQVVDLTWRKDYLPRSSDAGDLSWDTMFGPTRGNAATGQTRYWGVDHWASRAAQGDLIHWVVGNAMLPEVDPDPSHEGIQKIDRTTVPELLEFPALMEALQVSMDNAEAGLNPLGLPENTVPMDISPTVTSIEDFEDGYTHFEQVHTRALVALRNAAASFDDAKDVTRLMRSEQDSVADLQTDVSNQELAYKHTLIEVYGTPYPDDIGPGKTYSTGYDGPDFFHFMYVDTVRQDLENATHPDPTSTYTQRVDVQQYPSSWFLDPKTSFDWVQRGLYPSGTNDARSVTNYVEYHLDAHGFLQKPEVWTGRRGSPGEIQRAISEIIMAHNEAYEALKQHDARKYQLDRMIDVFENKVAAHAKVRGHRKELLVAEETLRWVKFAADNGVEWGELLYSFADKAQEAAKEAVPKVTIGGLAVGGDFLSGVRATITLGQAATKGSWDVAKQTINSALAAFENSVNTANDWVEFNDIGPTDWTQDLRESVYEIDMQLSDVQMTLHTIHGKLQALSAAYESYRSGVAKGDRIQAEREIFRQRAAAVIQGYRTRDAAFRIFRNEKLERYKTLQDTASKYA